MRRIMALGAMALLAAGIVESGQQVQASMSAAEVAPLGVEMPTLTQTTLAGTDAYGDGTVSWEQSEGGLAQAAQYLQFMQEGWGMA